MRISIILIFCIAFSGCTWVKVKPYAESVRVVGSDQVSSCRNLSTLNVHVPDKLIFIPRSVSKVKSELETVARNDSYVMGGDSIVPVSEVCEGRQTFYVYRCNP